MSCLAFFRKLQRRAYSFPGHTSACPIPPYDRPPIGGKHYRLMDPCEFVAGDFFEAIPPGADAYLMKSVLHNWDDAHARTILQACRQAIPPAGKLLVIDSVLPPGDEPSTNKMYDLVMLTLNAGGRERTEAELQALLAEAGFVLNGVKSAGWRQFIVEASPA